MFLGRWVRRSGGMACKCNLVFLGLINWSSSSCCCCFARIDNKMCLLFKNLYEFIWIKESEQIKHHIGMFYSLEFPCKYSCRYTRILYQHVFCKNKIMLIPIFQFTASLPICVEWNLLIHLQYTSGYWFKSDELSPCILNLKTNKSKIFWRNQIF